MTGTDAPHVTRQKADAARRLIRNAIRRAGAALAFERLWPAIVSALIVLALYCIVSWFGFWLGLPPVVRMGGAALFAIAFVAALLRLAKIRWPGHGEARHRVESSTGLAHRPLTALDDTLAGNRDPATERLWAAHRQRAVDTIDSLAAGFPAPRVAERDPYALRAIVVLLFVVSLAWAGPDWRLRLLSPAAPAGADEAQIARIDAWVSPPRYTGRPPVLLTGARLPAAEAEPTRTAEAGEPAPIPVPQGSQLIIRAPVDAGVAITAAFGDAEAAPVLPADGTDTAAAAKAPAEYAVALDESGRVAIALDEHQVFDWAFEVVADGPPSISFAEAPDYTATRALRLTYSVADDYGVVAAEAKFTPLDPKLAAADPLVPAPDFPLTLPQLRARSGNGQTIKELSSHPWAGSKVRVQLVARDDADQQGLSESVEITLPQRQFFEPLARAVVEQRRTLALDRNSADDVAGTLDVLALEPEKYIDDYGVYLGLRTAFWRLEDGDRSEETLRGVVDQLWEVALQIEDGDLSLAAEDLRAAQERLMQALEEGAPDDEIERLMAELREALNEFLRELAQRAMENQDLAQQMPMDPNAQTFSQNDLQRMLDAIENMARSGARDSARQMLSELRNLLENLRNGRMQPGQMQAGPMGEMLDQLGDLIRRQQELMDQTFQFNQGQQGQQGQQGEQGQQGQQGDQLGQLGQGQGDLREQLRQLMEQLEGMGNQPGSELGQAGEAMGEAEQSLGMGDAGDALDQQGRALDNLRRGAQSMAEQMAQGMAQGGQPGPNGRQRTDPFGRPLRTDGPDYGVTVKVPEEIDAQRAREILQELRRRLSDPSRPRIEKDYLERLLERF